MSFAPDPRIEQAKAIPIGEVVDRLGIEGLRRSGGELVGPCPLCGGRDRFGVNTRSGQFLCRKCDIRGGDGPGLVMAVRGVDFPGALDFLCGSRAAPLDTAEQARRRQAARAAERRRAEESARYRAAAIARAGEIWRQARGAEKSVVARYLAGRGLRMDRLGRFPPCLRVIPDHEYFRKVDGQVVRHNGPCMVAAIQAPDRRLVAVHQTWIEARPPHGKARILHGGQAQPAKLVRGSKKGGAIRLWTPKEFDTLVMGEGIETTLSALVADAVPGAAYWAGVDLGNMAGRMRHVPGKRHSGLPDMSDGVAFVPPPWVRRLIFIQDGDSEPAMTRAKLECGLRRAMALVPGLRGQIVQAGEGVDLNDVLVGAGE